MPPERTAQELLQDLCRRDPRYPLEAYDFLITALGFVQHRLREQQSLKAGDGPHHITGRQLAEGYRDLALQEFGLMARTVFRSWNLGTTADLGELMYNLINIGLMCKDENDRKEDFHNVYDVDAALGGYQIRMGE